MNKEVIQAQQEQLRLQAILIAEQRIMISGQSTMINEQNTMIKLLEVCVVVLENNQKKDSSNSSKPLSSNIGRAQRTQSLRTKSGKKAAGQPGRSGQTLTFSATPDQVVIPRQNAAVVAANTSLTALRQSMNVDKSLTFHLLQCW